MQVEAFDFDLPRERIADRPVRPRDSARLLVVSEGLSDARVSDLPKYLCSGDLIVVNDTRVIPARLLGHRGKAKVQVTLDRDLGNGRWRVLAYPARKLKPRDKVVFPSNFVADVVSRKSNGELIIDFKRDTEEVLLFLHQHGAVPLPPYISRPHGTDARDATDYQTIYADRLGAVAAPTAGLHFTHDLLSRLTTAGVELSQLTLHVGSGTFRPVNVADTRDHNMASEWGEISSLAAKEINDVRDSGGRVIAVGSTALRLLESASDESGTIKAFSGDTDLFITPGYRFKVANLLMTNFHLPRSTLFMLVAAFCGMDRIQAAYAHAIKKGYRFYSYGDASLLTLKPVG